LLSKTECVEALQVHLGMSGMSIFFNQIAIRATYGGRLLAIEAEFPQTDFTAARTTLLSIE
jgi:hypothetical protein